MIINSVFMLDEPADDVFVVLLDLDAVMQCIPGATLGPARGDGAREASVEVRFGPMRFHYAGTVRVAESDPHARRAVLEAKVNERAGEGNADARIEMQVVPIGAKQTRVEVVNDLTITGGAAQMGTGMIEDFAEEMLDDFVVEVRRLFDPEAAAALGGQAGGGPPLAATASRVTAAATPRPATPAHRREAVSASSLVWRVTRRRARRLWRRLGERLRSRRTADGAGARAGRAEPDYDLVVIGTGAGGLAAALAAHDAGLRVVIYEKAARIGGGTAYSAGVVWAPNNHIMRRKNIPDSVEDALQYLHGASYGRGDDVVQHRYVTTVAGIIEQVERWTGISWVIWTGQPDYYTDLPGSVTNGRCVLPHPNAASDVLLPVEEKLPGLALVRPTPHMDFVPGFQNSDRRPRDAWIGGRALIGGLWKVVLERGIEHHVSTPAVGLIKDGDAVVGVRVQPVGGAMQNVRAHAVLLNTGGFDWNEKLAHRYLPGPPPHPLTPPSNTGEGHMMAMDVGAGTALMDKAVWHPSIRIPGDTHVEGEQLHRMHNLELAKPHGIVVNTTGRRFATEAAYYALTNEWATMDVLAQRFPNVPSYFVCDATYRAKYGLPGVREGDEVPDWIHTDDTLEALAAKIGVDAAGLIEEVALYNTDCEVGVDSRFDRGRTDYERYWGDPAWEGPNPTMGPISAAPFYAYPLYLGHAGTRGGVTTSPDAQVMHADGRVIPGLYACGNTAANVLFGNSYASGSAVGCSLVFGYHAAKHVAALHASGSRSAAA